MIDLNRMVSGLCISCLTFPGTLESVLSFLQKKAEDEHFTVSTVRINSENHHHITQGSLNYLQSSLLYNLYGKLKSTSEEVRSKKIKPFLSLKVDLMRNESFP